MDETVVRFREGAAVKALTGRRLEVLAAPHGSPKDRDHLNEFFSARTDFMTDIGDKRPALYFHGFTPDKKMTPKPFTIGKATATRRDDDGLWMEVELNQGRLADRVYEAAEAGTCRASTGAVNYLCRTGDDGEVEVWPIGELSLLDEGLGRHPVNDKAVALPLRAAFEAQELEVPKVFGEDTEPEAQPEVKIIGDTKMAELTEAPKAEPAVDIEAIKAAVKASVLDEIKKEPKNKAMFAIGGEAVRGDKGLPAEKQESWAFFHQLRHGDWGKSSRQLDETTAAEGLPLVPQDALDQIISLRNETSLASRVGMTRYQTDKLIFNLPREVTAMTALAAIAEEGAYIANEPAFGLLPYTMQKYGSLITATEELLEDQNLFQPWFVKACGRAWALAENAAMYTEADLIGSSTIGVAVASDTITQAEFSEFFWTMTTPYRDKCVFIWHTAAMELIMNLQLAAATPYAFGAYPDQARNPLGLPSINGVPVHLCNNWPDPAAGTAAHVTLSMLNPDFCGIIERRALTIKVDPYGDALNGRIRFFPSVRFHCFFAQPLAHVVKEGV